MTVPLPEVVENGLEPRFAVNGINVPPQGPVPHPLLTEYVEAPVGYSY